MRACKLVLSMSDGTKVWINLEQMLKMTKTPDGNYYLYMVNGEKYQIDHSMARVIENCLEGR